MRREAVLFPRIEQDHFHGIQLDVGPNEEHVVRLAIRLVVETLDPSNACREIRIQRSQRDWVMSTPPVEGLDLGDEGEAVRDRAGSTPIRHSWKHNPLERAEDKGYRHKTIRKGVPIREASLYGVRRSSPGNS